jgi:hypothetical protein
MIGMKINLDSIEFDILSENKILIKQKSLIGYIAQELDNQAVCDLVKFGGWELMLEDGRYEVMLSEYGQEPEESMIIFIADFSDYTIKPTLDGLEIVFHSVLKEVL